MKELGAVSEEEHKKVIKKITESGTKAHLVWP